MLSDFLKRHITSQAGYIVKNGYGYGQVEPNHLSAQRTSQVYAQLPAAADINVLEQGQFVKYDYANGVVNFTGPGEWMLVFNEIKLYRDEQLDCEFAMIKDNYQARVYSPFGGSKDGSSTDTTWTKQSRWYNGTDSDGNASITLGRTYAKTTDSALDNAKTYYTYDVATGYTAVTTPDVEDIGDYYEMTNEGKTYNYDDVTAAPDMYEIHYNEDPFHIESDYKEAIMPAGTQMVPRVFKTNVGDIFTTNTIADQTVTLGQKLVPDASNKGILTVKANPTATDMVWQVVKVYTMPDHQPGVKVMRIQ